MKGPKKMAYINFLGGLCPEYEYFFCKYVPGGSGCRKRSLKAFQPIGKDV
jgi:hypothetical protein